jgi:hypothetical protein
MTIAAGHQQPVNAGVGMGVNGSVNTWKAAKKQSGRPVDVIDRPAALFFGYVL